MIQCGWFDFGDAFGGTSRFFDFDERLKRLSDIGVQLEAYTSAVDFEIFRADLDMALDYRSGSRGGRPPFDGVMMFMRFLGLGLNDKVPDAKTIRAFRERLVKASTTVAFLI